MNPITKYLHILEGVVVVGLVAGAAYLGAHYENVSWQAKWDAREMDLQEQRTKDEAARVKILEDHLKEVEGYVQQKRDTDARFADTKRMLDAARMQLKAASSAPTECRSYAAPTSQLSREDADVALAIAKDGDDAIQQLGLCQREYDSLVKRLNEDASLK